MKARIGLIATIVVALAFGTASAGASAQSACRQWQVPPMMEIIQNGQGGQRVYLQLKQEGSNFHGWAQYQTTKKTVIGNLSGNITGDAFHARVLWTFSGQSSIGQYSGKIRPREGGTVGNTMNGDIFEGSTYDEYVNPPKLQYWNAYHFTCQLDSPPAQKPAIALGRVQGTPSAAQTPICDAARSAKARNSPAAPGLERQCLASGGSLVQPITLEAARVDQPAVRISVLAPAVPKPQQAPPVQAPPQLPMPTDTDDLEVLASTGQRIAASDADLSAERDADPDPSYQYGFDIATALFGDPALGASGNTMMGPGSDRIRNALSPVSQHGFDASMNFYLERSK